MLANLLSSSYPGRRNQTDWDEQANAVARATSRRDLERYHSQALDFWLGKIQRTADGQARVLELKTLNPVNLEYLHAANLQVSCAALEPGCSAMESSETLLTHLDHLFAHRQFDAVLAWDLLLHLEGAMRDDLTQWISRHCSAHAPMLLLASGMANGELPSATYRIGEQGEVVWDTRTVAGHGADTTLMKGCKGFAVARKFLLRHGPTELVLQCEAPAATR